MRRHALSPETIAAIEIRTFGHAVRLGAHRPATTEEAQYALGFPVAAMAARGSLGASEITASGLSDERIASMLTRIRLVEDDALSARFPAERLAIVNVATSDGARHDSGLTTARGDPEDPLSDHDIAAKFDNLAAALAPARREAIKRAVAGIEFSAGAVAALAEAILRPVDSGWSIAGRKSVAISV